MKTETVPTAAHSFPGPFGVVTLMEDPLEAIFDLAETLLNLDLQDTNECRVVHRLAGLIKGHHAKTDKLRCELFRLTHPNTSAA
ncbi:hypothetical protein [Devosia naphthalenivorans]|uniref:hypothetical protein n=1 Tax=Devosia naphthalenivorans TaxID=2082392 RepID=UPI000D3C52B3|nr:hypothetical protein [Devosia naphthalenivorans]